MVSRTTKSRRLADASVTMPICGIPQQYDEATYRPHFPSMAKRRGLAVTAPDIQSLASDVFSPAHHDNWCPTAPYDIYDVTPAEMAGD